jgi:alpha-amylase
MQNPNGVMMQGFHWFLKHNFPGSNGRSLWRFLGDEAAALKRAGVDAVWLPPASKAAFDRSNSVGYDVYDHYDLGEFTVRDETDGRTKYGNRQELLAAARSLRDAGLGVYADIILNHKVGGAEDEGTWAAIRVDKEDRNSERWGEGFERGEIEIATYTKFDYAERGGRYSDFEWHARHFDSVDTAFQIRQGGAVFNDPPDKYIYRFLYNEEGFVPHDKRFESWVSLEKGNFDYLTGCDLDYGRRDVREEMKRWGEWLVGELGLDGVRLDAVKHIGADFAREWLGHVRWKSGRDLFAVAEYIAGGTGPLHDYVARVSAFGDFPQRVCLFDFPLRFKFGDAARQRGAYDLRRLNEGTFVAERPDLAVTFVENHDYEFGRGQDSHVEEWFKPLAYAFILLRAGGYPCVFFPDYYGSEDWVEGGKLWHQGHAPGREYLDLLMKLRKQFALGEERYYSERDVAGWVRMGFVPGAKGAMAVVVNNSPAGQVRAIRMNAGRASKRFYHLATIKYASGGFVVARGRYELYGDKAEGLLTDAAGSADFLADGSTAAIWIEDGVGLS